MVSCSYLSGTSNQDACGTCVRRPLPFLQAGPYPDMHGALAMPCPTVAFESGLWRLMLTLAPLPRARCRLQRAPGTRLDVSRVPCTGNGVLRPWQQLAAPCLRRSPFGWQLKAQVIGMHLSPRLELPTTRRSRSPWAYGHPAVMEVMQRQWTRKVSSFVLLPGPFAATGHGTTECRSAKLAFQGHRCGRTPLPSAPANQTRRYPCQRISRALSHPRSSLVVNRIWPSRMGHGAWVTTLIAAFPFRCSLPLSTARAPRRSRSRWMQPSLRPHAHPRLRLRDRSHRHRMPANRRARIHADVPATRLVMAPCLCVTHAKTSYILASTSGPMASRILLTRQPARRWLSMTPSMHKRC